MSGEFEVLDLKGWSMAEPYNGMLDRIWSGLPAIKQATRNFQKKQSQFMDFTLTVNQPTGLRSLRQILAEITKSWEALTTAYFKIQKKKIRIKILRRQAAEETDTLEKELLNLRADEKENEIEITMGYFEAAVRRVSAFMVQFDQVKKAHGVDEVTEELFEADEERYHIMTAFAQGLTAARARPGNLIDEGNHIYLYQLGISGAAAQDEVNHILKLEREYLERKEVPPHALLSEWLKALADKYAGSAADYAKRRGLKLLDAESCI